MIVLRFVGDGQAWVPGVPARDLNEEDLILLEATHTATELAGYRPAVYELVEEGVQPNAPTEITPIERADLRGIVKLR